MRQFVSRESRADGGEVGVIVGVELGEELGAGVTVEEDTARVDSVSAADMVLATEVSTTAWSTSTSAGVCIGA